MITPKISKKEQKLINDSAYEASQLSNNAKYKLFVELFFEIVKLTLEVNRLRELVGEPKIELACPKIEDTQEERGW